MTISGTTYGGTSGSQTSPMPSPYNAEELKKINAVKSELNLDHPKRLWVDQHGGFVVQLHDFLASEMWSPEAEEFGKAAIDILIVDPSANPFLGADCRSFEYAQPAGALQKGCAVKDFNHTFYTIGIDSNGSPYYGETESIIEVAYFTMPSGMTNGRAANLTAKAVTAAIKATDLYYAANPRVSKYTLGEYFKNSINSALKAVGGSVSTNPPFNIPSPAPYITSIIGISTPYDCE